MNEPVQIIPIERAQWCVSCNCISDVRGDTCPACGDNWCLLNVSRALRPNPQTGQIERIEVHA